MFNKQSCMRLNTYNAWAGQTLPSKAYEALINKKGTNLAQDSFSVSGVPRRAAPLKDYFLTALRNTLALFTGQPPPFGILFIVLLAGFHFPSDIFKRKKKWEKERSSHLHDPFTNITDSSYASKNQGIFDAISVRCLLGKALIDQTLQGGGCIKKVVKRNLWSIGEFLTTQIIIF